jgi:hypothetical protein
MMFHNRSAKPFYLDPETLEPNVINAAMRAALQMLGRLSAFNDPASSASCLPYDARFCAGDPPPLALLLPRPQSDQIDRAIRACHASATFLVPWNHPLVTCTGPEGCLRTPTRRCCTISQPV